MRSKNFVRDENGHFIYINDLINQKDIKFLCILHKNMN